MQEFYSHFISFRGMSALENLLNLCAFPKSTIDEITYTNKTNIT